MARVIDLGHGAGGIKMHKLIRETFGAGFAEFILENADDSAVLDIDSARLAFTTDGFVVRPIEFPGGDIGKLSVCGTVNDLSMVGAVPRWLSVSFIIEEGFDEELLERVSRSIGETARQAGVSVVTGDTKVVERGAVDGLFVVTSGLGVLSDGVNISGDLVRPGMAVIVNGTVGDHETAILNAREKIVKSGELVSDCAPLNGLVASMVNGCHGIACMRDPTRGGLATTLNEIAHQSGTAIEIDESLVPLKPAVKGFCDLLGLDPLYMACEGRLIAIVDNEHTEKIVEIMKKNALGTGTEIIGRVTEGEAGMVIGNTVIGGRRILPMLSGKPIPRIC